MSNGQIFDTEISERAAFIHSKLDDYQLTAAQFRVYCHIARRVNCFERLDTFAATCRLNRKTVEIALKLLLRQGLIAKEYRHGTTSVYRVLPMSTWKPLAPRKRSPNAIPTPYTEPAINLPQSEGAKVYPQSISQRREATQQPHRNSWEPSLEAVVAHFRSLGLPEQIGADFFNRMDAIGWRDDDMEPILDWQRYLEGWIKSHSPFSPRSG